MNKIFTNISAIIISALILSFNTATSQSIALKGIAGKKALISIDNAQPVFMKTGQKIGGITIEKIGTEDVIFSKAGEKFTVKIGYSHFDKLSKKPNRKIVSTNKPKNVSLTTQQSSTPGRLVIESKSQKGHFYITEGLYDNKPVNYVIDTGASLVAISIDDALKLGIDYSSGQKSVSNTAGGKVNSYIVKAPSITVGPFTFHDIDTVVSSASFFEEDYTLLLGQSFLSKVRLIQEDGKVILESK